MTTIIRIEHISGDGIFGAKNPNGNWVLNRDTFECYSALSGKHSDFPTPYEDKGIGRVINDDEYCAFKSIEQVQQWIEKDWFYGLVNNDFKVLMLDVSECVIGEYQVLFKKENILQSKDITNLFL